MVHKEFIERDGKVYGPYYYESYRGEDGRVTKRYFSEEPKKPFNASEKSRVIYSIIAIFLLIFARLFIYLRRPTDNFFNLFCNVVIPQSSL